MYDCYFGTYASDGGEGIYRSTFNPLTGELSKPNLFCEAKNSKYLFCENDKVFTVQDNVNSSGVGVYSKNGNLVDYIACDSSTPCYIVKNGNMVYTANYHESSVTAINYQNNRLSKISRYVIQEKAGCHQIIFVGNQLFVPCLLLDKIYIFDKNLKIIGSIDFPKGSGPRHGCLSTIDSQFLYVVGELSDKLYTLKYEQNKWNIIYTLDLIPKGIPLAKESAALRMSTNGKFLMISIRTANIIVIVDISKKKPIVKQIYSSKGNHPRDILNIIDDKYLLVANRLTNNVVVLALKNYEIVRQCSEINISGVVTIGIMED